MKLAIGGDHAGFDYKKQMVEFLEKEGHEVKDFGPHSDASVDYPDHVHPLSAAVEKGEFTRRTKWVQTHIRRLSGDMPMTKTDLNAPLFHLYLKLSQLSSELEA